MIRASLSKTEKVPRGHGEPRGRKASGRAASKRFKSGDHVSWNSEAGRVRGRIIKVHTKDTFYKGHRRHASEAEPQYEIVSDRTEHIAMHKGKALRKLRS